MQASWPGRAYPLSSCHGSAAAHGAWSWAWLPPPLIGLGCLRHLSWQPVTTSLPRQVGMETWAQPPTSSSAGRSCSREGSSPLCTWLQRTCSQGHIWGSTGRHRCPPHLRCSRSLCKPGRHRHSTRGRTACSTARRAGNSQARTCAQAAGRSGSLRRIGAVAH